MKKLHFSLLAILFALFAMVSFTACSSDDEDTPSPEDVQTYIIGMWQPTHVTGYDWDEHDKPAKVDKDIDIDDAASSNSSKVALSMSIFGLETNGK